MYEVLCSEWFVDASPAETAATLLDEGVYLCRPLLTCSSSRFFGRAKHLRFRVQST